MRYGRSRRGVRGAPAERVNASAPGTRSSANAGAHAPVGTAPSHSGHGVSPGQRALTLPRSAVTGSSTCSIANAIYRPWGLPTPDRPRTGAACVRPPPGAVASHAAGPYSVHNYCVPRVPIAQAAPRAKSRVTRGQMGGRDCCRRPGGILGVRLGGPESSTRYGIAVTLCLERGCRHASKEKWPVATLLTGRS